MADSDNLCSSYPKARNFEKVLLFIPFLSCGAVGSIIVMLRLFIAMLRFSSYLTLNLITYSIPFFIAAQTKPSNKQP